MTNVPQTTTRRNEGGRYSAKSASDWYKAIEAENLAQVEAEQAMEAYARAQAREEAGFRAHLAQEEAALVQAQLDAEQAEQAALQALTAAAKDALPGQDTRIDKGAALVAAHAVWPLTSGSWLVGSQTDAQAAYLVHRPNDTRNGHGGHGWTCDCKDFQGRGGACKHILGAMIAVRLGDAYEACYN